MHERTLLNQKIDAVRHEYRRAHRRAVWASCMATALVVFVALVILDRIFALPIRARQLLLGAAAVGLVISFLVLCVKRVWRKLPDEKVALYVEERLSGFDDALVTAAAVKPEDLPPEERPLAEALLRRVVRKLKRRNLTSAVDFGVARKAVVAAVLGFVLALVIAGCFPRQTGRVLFPVSRFRSNPQAAALQIDVTPKSIEVERGSSAEIAAKVNGVARRDATLVYTPADDSARRVPMQWQDASERYEAVLTDITSDGVYKVVLKGRASPEYPVTTFVPPAIESVEHIYTFPDYLRMPPEIGEGGELSAVQGTKAKLTFQLNKPVEKCEVIIAPDQHLPVQLDEQEAQIEVEIKEDGIYTIHLADADGHTNGKGDEFKIYALPDNPPEITIVEPGGDVELDEGKEQAIRIESTDDFGVAKLVLIFNMNGGEDCTVDLDDLQTDIPPRTRIGKFLVCTNTINIQPGDVMTYYGEAEDANTLTGPGKSQTKRFFIFGMLPYEDIEGNPGPYPPPTPLTAIQRQIIVATAVLTEVEGEEAKTFEHFDDCKDVGVSEAELLRIVESIHIAATRKGDLEKEMACQEVEPLLRSARDSLKAHQPEKALAAEQKSLPLLYQLDSKVRKKSRPSDKPPSDSEQLFHDLMTKQVTESSLPTEMKEGKPCDGNQQVMSEEHAPEIIAAVRRMEDLARRQMNLGKEQEQADQADEGDQVNQGDQAGAKGRAEENERLAQEQKELAEAAEKLAEELEKAASKGRGTSALAAAAAQLKEAARQMKSNAKGMGKGGRGSGKASASARAAEQSLLKALERLSMTSERSIAEQLEDAATDARALAERKSQLSKPPAAGSDGRKGSGKGRNTDDETSAEEAAMQKALDNDIQEWSENLDRLHGVAGELAESGAVPEETVKQIEKVLGQIPEGLPVNEGALMRAAELLDAAATLETSLEKRMALAAQDVAELVEGIEQSVSGARSEGKGTQPGKSSGLGKHGAWNKPDWACLVHPGVRDTALILADKLAGAEELSGAEQLEFLEVEVLPVARKLEAQLLARATGKPEDLLVMQGFDDNYPPEYRAVVEDYFKKLAQHPELAPSRESEAETLP